MTTDIRWFIAIGVPGVGAAAITVSLLQQHAGPAPAGHVLSTYTAVFGGVQTGGMLLAGFVGTHAGLTAVLQVQGALHLVNAALAPRVPATLTRRQRLPHRHP